MFNFATIKNKLNQKMNKYLLPIVSASIIIVASACQNNGSNSAKPKVAANHLDLLKSHVDSTIASGDDFFEYANGGWLKAHPIPATESGWGIFKLVDEENQERIRKISEEASSSSGKKGSNSQLIGDFFSAGMDSVGIEKIGIGALKAELEIIDNIKTLEDVNNVTAQLQTKGIGPFYGMYIGQDLENSEKMVVNFVQGGLGMPDRDYYFNTDKTSEAVRAEYPLHITKMFTLMGIAEPQAKLDAAAIVTLESAMAKSHRKLEALRDPQKNNNPMSLANFEKLAPNAMISKQLNATGIKVDSLIIGQPEFFTAYNTLLKTTPIETIKKYLKWHLVSGMAPFLNSAIDKENFRFYSTVLDGTKEQRPRWKRVLDMQEKYLGDALGQLFVKQYFPEKTKKRYEEMTDKVMEAYAEHIKNLDWMSDSTKAKAIKKLNAITKKIAYPAKWRDYSNMNISRTSLAQNAINGNKWLFDYEKNKLGKPVDRTEWSMTPQTYNAYYNPSNNEIVIPAAMFTAPGYADAELDDAIMYGYVGASTIGHELTHGFDDQGRQFDEKGNMKNWWTKEDEAKFKVRAAALVKQFNTYTVLGDKHPNGEASLGENIADLGGVVVGLDAFKKTKQYQENKLIAGLTPTQRYFMGYAYGWMHVRRPEKLAAQLMTDVHAPIFLRVNGPMSNCDEWYKAFNVQPSNKMYRDSSSRVRIW
jgi:putative endopeptidase